MQVPEELLEMVFDENAQPPALPLATEVIETAPAPEPPELDETDIAAL